MPCSPQRELLVETGNVGVVREDDGNAGGAGSAGEARGVEGRLKQNGLEGTARRVAQLVDDQQGA